MWSIYVEEAGKFDKAMVESWRGDMEGILIFAGLFSVSLTAFIIESYKKLSPDSGELTAALLAQISSQLVAISNGTNLVISSPSPINDAFQPTSSAVTVNILWFLSLALALLCALSATMVEQWARNYLQLIDRRPAPNQRARIRAYLYEGIKTFKMMAVIEAIPTLLHVSLFFFFIGLVIFLFPVDLRVALPILIILVLDVILYTVITFLPMVSQNSPYQSPLSPACWNILQRLKLPRYSDSSGEKKLIHGSIVEGREALSTEAVRERDERDKEALLWTLQNLTDDCDLECSSNAIPEFLRTDDGHHLDLLDALGPHCIRIWDLLDGCREHAGLEVSRRRRRTAICMAALQAMAPKLPWLLQFSIQYQGNALADLRDDNDSTIATQAICTSARMISACLTDFVLDIHIHTITSRVDVKDGQLLNKAYCLIPVDAKADSRLRYDPLVSLEELNSEILAGIECHLRRGDLLDAVDRYLSCDGGYSRLARNGKVLLDTFEDSGVEIDRLRYSLRWLSDDVIREAKEAVLFLRNPEEISDGLSPKRAVVGILSMLQSMKMVNMHDVLLNFGRLVIINSLLSRLTQSQHDSRDHTAAVLETLRHLMPPNFSPNDADIETQTDFLQLVKDVVSANPLPLAFPVLQVLLQLFKKFEHPTSIAPAIDIIDNNLWLQKSGFPSQESLKQLRERLAQKTDKVALETLIALQTPLDSSGSINNRPEGGASGTQDSTNTSPSVFTEV